MTGSAMGRDPDGASAEIPRIRGQRDAGVALAGNYLLVGSWAAGLVTATGVAASSAGEPESRNTTPVTAMLNSTPATMPMSTT